MIANIHLLTPRRQSTQFATIKSPIDAVKFSNTMKLSPNSCTFALGFNNFCSHFRSFILVDLVVSEIKMKVSN
jgi:hypothetical protein